MRCDKGLIVDIQTGFQLYLGLAWVSSMVKILHSGKESVNNRKGRCNK